MKKITTFVMAVLGVTSVWARGPVISVTKEWLRNTWKYAKDQYDFYCSPSNDQKRRWEIPESKGKEIEKMFVIYHHLSVGEQLVIRTMGLDNAVIENFLMCPKKGFESVHRFQDHHLRGFERVFSAVTCFGYNNVETIYGDVEGEETIYNDMDVEGVEKNPLGCLFFHGTGLKEVDNNFDGYISQRFMADKPGLGLLKIRFRNSGDEFDREGRGMPSGRHLFIFVTIGDEARKYGLEKKKPLYDPGEDDEKQFDMKNKKPPYDPGKNVPEEGESIERLFR